MARAEAARTFSSQHDLLTALDQRPERIRKRKRLDGETTQDETLVGEKRLKVDVWCRSLDAVICQMNMPA